MDEDVTIDVRLQDGLARLTDNEKECLRRRLRQQTAKEMALELGISPHAAEKRLKMARTKLGLSSSLEAARLLAASEEYQRTGSQASDLSTIEPGAQTRSHRPLIIGSSIMLGVIAAGLVVTLQASGDDVTPQSVPTGEPEVVTVDGTDWEIVPPGEVRAFLTDAFARLDKDRSGAIDQSEVPGFGFRIGASFEDAARSKPTDEQAQEGRRRWIAVHDSNEDRRVDLEEYLAGRSGGTLRRRVEPAA